MRRLVLSGLFPGPRAGADSRQCSRAGDGAWSHSLADSDWSRSLVGGWAFPLTGANSRAASRAGEGAWSCSSMDPPEPR